MWPQAARESGCALKDQSPQSKQQPVRLQATVWCPWFNTYSFQHFYFNSSSQEIFFFNIIPISLYEAGLEIHENGPLSFSPTITRILIYTVVFHNGTVCDCDNFAVSKCMVLQVSFVTPPCLSHKWLIIHTSRTSALEYRVNRTLSFYKQRWKFPHNL